jgi:hypothetical protein
VYATNEGDRQTADPSRGLHGGRMLSAHGTLPGALEDPYVHVEADQPVWQHLGDR